MKRISIICIALLVLSVTIIALMTSCKQQPVFEEVTVTTTAAHVTEPVTYVYSDFVFQNTRMGMSLEETQQALGEPIAIRTSENGMIFFIIAKKGLDFVKEDAEVPLYFIYDYEARLCEVQYSPTPAMGYNADKAIDKLDGLYGEHAEVTAEEGKQNYVWFSNGDYIVVTRFADGRNAVSYFAKAYFESTQPEEAKAYNDLQSGQTQPETSTQAEQEEAHG